MLAAEATATANPGQLRALRLAQTSPLSRQTKKARIPAPEKMPRQKSIVGRSASIVRTNRPEVDQHKAAIATSASPTLCCAGLDSITTTCGKTQSGRLKQGSTL